MAVIEGERPGAHADFALRSGRGLRRLIVGGDIGFAEGYRYGDWDTSDLKAVLAWTGENETALNGFGGLTVSRVLNRLQHRLRSNTRTNSKRNIQAHYDLGNAFYAACSMLDCINSSVALSRPAGARRQSRSTPPRRSGSRCRPTSRR